eukprot:gene14532-30928_t
MQHRHESKLGLSLESRLVCTHSKPGVPMTAALPHHIEAASPHVMNTYGRLPIALSHGQGCRVWDVNGKCYLDALGGIAVNTL